MKEVRQRDDQSALDLETSVLGILSTLNQDIASDKQPPWIRKLYELLHDECNTSFSLTALSEILNVHPVTISKYFPKFFHTTIGDYIRKIKAERSLAELGRKSIAIEEIATKYGFVDNAHYTRIFKKHTGITPSQYRKLITG